MANSCGKKQRCLTHGICGGDTHTAINESLYSRSMAKVSSATKRAVINFSTEATLEFMLPTNASRAGQKPQDRIRS
jgi:hypothetical protein